MPGVPAALERGAPGSVDAAHLRPAAHDRGAAPLRRGRSHRCEHRAAHRSVGRGVPVPRRHARRVRGRAARVRHARGARPLPRALAPCVPRDARAPRLVRVPPASAVHAVLPHTQMAAHLHGRRPLRRARAPHRRAPPARAPRARALRVPLQRVPRRRRPPHPRRAPPRPRRAPAPRPPRHRDPPHPLPGHRGPRCRVLRLVRNRNRNRCAPPARVYRHVRARLFASLCFAAFLCLC